MPYSSPGMTTITERFGLVLLSIEIVEVNQIFKPLSLPGELNGARELSTVTLRFKELSLGKHYTLPIF